MSCTYIKNEKGNIIGAAASNGQPSKLFQSLLNSTENVQAAKKAYDLVRSPKFIELYGRDFETEEALKSETVKQTDDNGEPILVSGRGSYYILSPSSTKRIEIPGLNIPLTRSVSNFSYEKEREVIDTVISFVNDFRKRN